jgi:hypothetical protein
VGYLIADYEQFCRLKNVSLNRFGISELRVAYTLRKDLHVHSNAKVVVQTIVMILNT